MKPVRVRAEHLHAIAELETLVFHTPWSERSLAMLCEESAIAMVCLSGEVAAAYGGMITVLDEGQITDVATHPDFRRQGLGDSVLGAMLDAARERGLARVTLEVRESNAPAIALYQKHGFSVWGRRARFYTHPSEDALVMGVEFEQ